MTASTSSRQRRKTPNWLEQDPEYPLSAIETSPFGELPIEIRLHIYSFLVTPGTIHIWRCNSLLSNTLCPQSSHDPRTFGATGTLKELVASKELSQDEVVEEAVRSHKNCHDHRKSSSKHRISFSLFLTCRLFHAEGKDFINKIYATSTFHFIQTQALELFVDNISPAHKSLLTQVHINLHAARSYKGVRCSLNQTFNRLAPNPYTNGPLANRIHYRPPKLRLRIQFAQYRTDDVFYYTVAPTIHNLLSQLPAYIFSSIVVIVPPLPPPFMILRDPVTRQRYRIEDQVKWYTKLIPSHSLECLCQVVTDTMGSRDLIQVAQKEQHGTLRPNQWICCDNDRGHYDEWWMAGRRDLEVRWSMVFGV